MSERAESVRNLLADLAPLHTVERLIDEVIRFPGSMPVAKWWHGDFAYWNVGRTPDGTLWCWDFENAERDALAGLDVIHWHASRMRARQGAAGVADREAILADSRETLRAFGITAPGDSLALYQTYVAEIGLRTLEMVAADGWERVWTSESDFQALIRQTTAL